MADNVDKLVIYVTNLPRPNSTKGTKDFQTTRTFRNIRSIEKAAECVNDHLDDLCRKYNKPFNYSTVIKIYWNGKDFTKKILAKII